MNFEDKYYTVKELGEKLKLSPQSIRRSIRNCRISAIKVGTGKKAEFRIHGNQIEKLWQLTEDELKKDMEVQDGDV